MTCQRGCFDDFGDPRFGVTVSRPDLRKQLITKRVADLGSGVWFEYAIASLSAHYSQSS